MLHKIYLPFSEEIMKEHFVQSIEDKENIHKHISKYTRSIKNYALNEINNQVVSKIKVNCQIEKDEIFWTASSLMTIFHSKNRDIELKKLLVIAFGSTPPLKNLTSWEECLNGELNLFFEPNIPSPKEYREWLKKNITTQNFIPYVLQKAQNKKGEYRQNLEGPTNVDALLINKTNGFSVLIEAKVLSDISYQVSYNSMRNQIIRNIDVMLSSNPQIVKPLNYRLQNNSLFLLLTPKLFKDNPRSRLYGYTFLDYKNNSKLISDDLPHRNLDLEDCKSISNRIGWITWEDLKEVNNDCCTWIKKK